jgi:hypothetical protein
LNNGSVMDRLARIEQQNPYRKALHRILPHWKRS